jgi:hypothetical protein
MLDAQRPQQKWYAAAAAAALVCLFDCYSNAHAGRHSTVAHDFLFDGMSFMFMDPNSHDEHTLPMCDLLL